MLNPDALTAHEQRVDFHLDRLDHQIEQLEAQPATPYNRLLLLRSKFERQMWLNSWYKLDKGQETPAGREIIEAERRERLYWQQCYLHCNTLIASWARFRGQRLDLTGIERWLDHQEPAHA